MRSSFLQSNVCSTGSFDSLFRCQYTGTDDEVCLLETTGGLFCYDQGNGAYRYVDGYTLYFGQGLRYTTPEGDEGDLYTGPCPGQRYEENDDLDGCTQADGYWDSYYTEKGGENEAASTATTESDDVAAASTQENAASSPFMLQRWADSVRVTCVASSVLIMLKYLWA